MRALLRYQKTIPTAISNISLRCLRVPNSYSVLRHQLHPFGSLEINSFVEEFLQSRGVLGIREKFRQAISERHRAHLFGWRNAWSNGSHPRAKEAPDRFGIDRSQELHQPLGNQAQLNVCVIGAQFSQHVS